MGRDGPQHDGVLDDLRQQGFALGGIEAVYLAQLWPGQDVAVLDQQGFRYDKARPGGQHKEATNGSASAVQCGTV